MSAFAPLKLSSIAGGVLVTSSNTIGVDRTFDPDVIDTRGVARWVNRSGNVPAGFPEISMSLRRPVRGSPNYKTTGVLSLPTLETLGTASSSGIIPGASVGYRNTFRLEATLHQRSTIAERIELFCLARSLLAEVINAADGSPTDSTGSPFPAAITTLEGVW